MLGITQGGVSMITKKTIQTAAKDKQVSKLASKQDYELKKAAEKQEGEEIVEQEIFTTSSLSKKEHTHQRIQTAEGWKREQLRRLDKKKVNN
jgi:hypothetical protein